MNYLNRQLFSCRPFLLHMALLVISGFVLTTLGAADAKADSPGLERDGRHCSRENSYGGPGPFYAIDYVLVPHLYGVAICNGDVESMRSFWRSYYRYFGCSADSGAAASIEWMLETEKKAYTPEAKRYYGTYITNNPKVCEEVLKTCTLPPEYDPDDPAISFNCTFLELKEEVRKAFEPQHQPDID